MRNNDLRSKAENGGFLSEKQQRALSLCIPYCFGPAPKLKILKGGANLDTTEDGIRLECAGDDGGETSLSHYKEIGGGEE